MLIDKDKVLKLLKDKLDKVKERIDKPCIFQHEEDHARGEEDCLEELIEEIEKL